MCISVKYTCIHVCVYIYYYDYLCLLLLLLFFIIVIDVWCTPILYTIHHNIHVGLAWPGESLRSNTESARELNKTSPFRLVWTSTGAGNSTTEFTFFEVLKTSAMFYVQKSALSKWCPKQIWTKSTASWYSMGGLSLAAPISLRGGFCLIMGYKFSPGEMHQHEY